MCCIPDSLLQQSEDRTLLEKIPLLHENLYSISNSRISTLFFPLVVAWSSLNTGCFSALLLKLSVVNDAVMLGIGILVDTHIRFIIVSQIACKLDFTGQVFFSPLCHQKKAMMQSLTRSKFIPLLIFQEHVFIHSVNRCSFLTITLPNTTSCLITSLLIVILSLVTLLSDKHNFTSYV